jgi:hypothetical protein
MRFSTKFRLFLAQLIMMLSCLFFGATWIHDHHWPEYLYWVNVAIVAALGFLIPSGVEAYQKGDDEDTRR